MVFILSIYRLTKISYIKKKNINILHALFTKVISDWTEINLLKNKRKLCTCYLKENTLQLIWIWFLINDFNYILWVIGLQPMDGGISYLTLGHRFHLVVVFVLVHRHWSMCRVKWMFLFQPTVFSKLKLIYYSKGILN